MTKHARRGCQCVSPRQTGHGHLRLVVHVPDSVPPSSCTPHSAVRYCAFECVTPPFKVSFHNLWPPADLHLLSRCPGVLECVARPTAREDGDGDGNVLPARRCFRFICPTLLRAAPLSNGPNARRVSERGPEREPRASEWHPEVWRWRLCAAEAHTGWS